jgi:DNA repair exonuclease SbcCD ATPase subunit
MAIIDNSDDIIDSRELIDEIETLEGERGDLESAVEEAEEALQEAREALAEADPIEQQNGADPSGELAAALAKAKEELADWDEANGAELKALQAFAAEFEDYCPDWTHGVTLIRESYFTDYCEQTCKDCGYISDDFPGWIAIDWDKTADNMRMDYTEGDFDGVTYLAR